MALQDLSAILQSAKKPGNLKTPQELGLQIQSSQPDMITKLRGMGKSEQDINQIMSNVGGTPKGEAPVTGIEAIRPLGQIGLMDRMKSAGNAIIDTEKTMIGGGVKKVAEGAKGIYQAFTSPDTYVAERGEGESVPTPEGEDRGIINRMQEATMEFGDMMGGLGTIALGVAPATPLVAGAIGAIQPEIETAVKGYTEAWKSLPGNVRRSITDFTRNIQIPGSQVSLGQVADEITNAPADVKRGFMDIVKTTGLLTIPSTLRQYQKGIDFLKPSKPYEETMKGKMQTGQNLGDKETIDAKAMRKTDPKRASQLADKADDLAKGDREASPMKDVGQRIKQTRDGLLKQKQAIGKEIGTLRKGIGADDLPVYTKDYAEDMMKNLASNYNVKFVKAPGKSNLWNLADDAFSDSSIPLSDQKYIENMYNKLAQGKMMKYGDLEANVNRWGKELYSPTGEKALGDAATTFEKGVREGARKIVTAQYPELTEPLSKYSELTRSINDIDRVIGLQGEKATAFVRLVNGANWDRYERTLQSLEDLAAKYGITNGTNLINEARYAGDLEALATPKPFELAGRIRSAINSPKSLAKNVVGSAINEKVVGTPLETVRKIVEYSKSAKTPALLRLADWLEKDITPQIQSLLGKSTETVSKIAKNRTGGINNPTYSVSKEGSKYILKEDFSGRVQGTYSSKAEANKALKTFNETEAGLGLPERPITEPFKPAK